MQFADAVKNLCEESLSKNARPRPGISTAAGRQEPAKSKIRRRKKGVSENQNQTQENRRQQKPKAESRRQEETDPYGSG